MALIACQCKRKCAATKCCCIDNGFRCPTCGSIECTNMDVVGRINTSIEETAEVDFIDSEDDSGEDK